MTLVLKSWTVPATTISPSGWMVRPAAKADAEGPKLVATRPPVPKVASSLPLALYRASPNSSMKLVSKSWSVPATTILPSAWTATPAAVSDVFGPKLAGAPPPDPKEVSRLPPTLKRATAKSLLNVVGSAIEPATTTLPPG